MTVKRSASSSPSAFCWGHSLPRPVEELHDAHWAALRVNGGHRRHTGRLPEGGGGKRRSSSLELAAVNLITTMELTGRKFLSITETVQLRRVASDAPGAERDRRPARRGKNNSQTIPRHTELKGHEIRAFEGTRSVH